MKFFHLSDLHIGKHLHSYSLYELQRDVFQQIVEKAIEKRPDAILISGDIYDKSVPSGEAYTLFDGFLSDLSEITPKIPVLIIAGNHDSAERLNYASGFLERHGIILEVLPPRSLEEELKKITLTDEFGDVDFYLLPFMKPGYVRYLFEDGKSISYQKAVQTVLERADIDYDRRNVLLSHQFYINGNHEPETCESELSYISVGGVDSVDISVVDKFDYVALGHIHGAQIVGKNHIRYCGTPLKYSVSEEKHEKAIAMVTLGDKGSEITFESIPLRSIRDVRSEKGRLHEILERATEANRHDYVSITLTDEEELYQPKDKLEEVYDHI
ncbi:MAG: exonuclease SbcCD subunit D, partial [Vallitaleaceae bacterium]|nr:exonuclease SbcCD subunit D [Vallitaleaceae bacterium]